MRNEPIWTAETKSMLQGATTMETCGWCEYVSAGTFRYSCALSGKCSLLKSYDEDVEWNTPCILKHLGRADVESVIENKKYSIKDYQRQINNRESEIQKLQEMYFEDIPPLPNNRRCEHFNIGDKVKFYPMFESAMYPHQWVSGVVVLGYRHHDGCVQVTADYEYCTEGDRKTYGSGICLPTIMLAEEYQYFKRNPTKFTYWIKRACKHCRINPDHVII